MRLKNYANIFMLIILSIAISSVGYAKIDYNQTGSTNAQFKLGRGEFNVGVDDSIATKVLNGRKQNAYVSDIDLDGIQDIIAFNGDDIQFWHNKELDVIDAFDVGDASDTFSNIIISDIDGDGWKEIIVANEDEQIIYILQYNASWTSTEITFNDTSHVDGQTMIQCDSQGFNCLMTYTQRKRGSSTPSDGLTRNIYAMQFNSTGHGSETTIDTNSGFNTYCFPRIKSISRTDFDNDAVDEYIFSAVDARGSTPSDDFIEIYYLELIGSSVVLDNQYTESQIGQVYINNEDCNDINYKFSNTITFNIDGIAGNGKETVTAFKLSSTNSKYVMKSYDGCSVDGCTISEFDDYPETCDTLGNCPNMTSLSNIFRMDIFDGSDTVDDFCVIGYQSSEMDIICGSETASHFGTETIEFLAETSGFSPDLSIEAYDTLTHAVQHSSSVINGKDIDEILTPYGIYATTDNTEFAPNFNSIYDIGIDNIAVIAVNAEKVSSSVDGAEDLIGITDTNIFYIDDGLSGEPPSITNIVYSPCIVDSTVKVNTTIEIDITIQDNNPSSLGQNSLNLNVTTYKGTSNEFLSQFAGIASGTTFPISITLNKTGNAQTMEFVVADAQDGSDTQTQLFSVANNGITEGDSSCSLSFEAEEDDEEEGDTAFDGTSTTNNAVTQGVNDIGGLFGLGGGITFLLIVIITGIAVFTIGAKGSGSVVASAGISIFVMFMLLILGTLLNIVNIGIIVAIVVVGIAIIAIIVRSMITGQSS